ncbi:MAG: site-specific DNA-methyltransferase [Curvibacter sp.]|nr:site-specific DNA-methyltransferase [Curvibacter sp.]
MQKIEAASPEAQSANLVADNVSQLQALFPELVTEGPNGPAVNVDVLKALVGDATVTDAEERYGLNWHGKRAARQLALTPSAGTLRPSPKDSVNWDSTQNLFIEGDNLEALKLLQKSFSKKIKMIYVDPPYNTGKDFIYRDNFQSSLSSYLEQTHQADGGQLVTSNPESSGRFHTDWLNMLYPRLKLARSLLRRDGVIFLSIDDNEQHSLRLMMDEVFGQENYCATFVWNTEGNTDNQYTIKVNHEYILAYYYDANYAESAIGRVVDPNTREDSNLWKGVADNNINKNNPENPPSIVELPIGFPCAEETLLYPKKNVDQAFFDQVAIDKFISDPIRERYGIEKKSGLPVKLDDMVVSDHKLVKPCRIFVGMANKNKLLDFIANGCQPINDDGSPLRFYLNSNAAVRYNRENDRPRNILSVIRNVGTTERSKTILKNKGIYYDYPKPATLLEYLVRIGCEDKQGIVLDFFAGSGTTGEAVMNLNASEKAARRFICIQLPEKTEAKSDARIRGFNNLAEIGRRRLAVATEDLRMAQGPLLSGEIRNLGFRSFRLDSSNIRAWVPAASGMTENLLAHAEHLLPGRTDEDILAELLLKLGLDLCVPTQARSAGGKPLRSIAGGVLITCLAPQIASTEVESLAQSIVAWHKELAPAGDTTCVFRDSAFADDVAKTNMAAILEQNGIANVRSL